MKAAQYTHYGPPEVLKIVDVEPPQPQPHEVLIQVFASTVNRTDCGYRSAKYVISRLFTGLLRPKYTIGGSEFAGKIVAVGSSVKEYSRGDNVFGFDDVRGGAHAEYVVKPSNGPFVKMPDGFDYTQLAAAGEGATYALNILQAVNLKAGQKALVYGASGAIGSAAVQMLKHQGIIVTAVCGTNSFERVQSLGPDTLIDYQKQDFTQCNERFDLVFDAVGKSSYGVCKKLLTPKGTYYSSELGKGGQNPLLALWFGVTRSKRVIFPIPKINKTNLQIISEMIQAGAFRPLIDKIYPLDKIVEATQYVESEQKVGNVVITIAEDYPATNPSNESFSQIQNSN